MLSRTVEIAKADKNYVGVRFLDWFVEEQLEEVTTMNDLLAVIRRAWEATTSSRDRARPVRYRITSGSASSSTSSSRCRSASGTSRRRSVCRIG